MRHFRPRILIIASFPPPVHGAAMVSQQIKDSASINEAFRCDYINISTSRNINEIGQEGILLTAKKGYRFISALLITACHLFIQRYDLCYCAITCHGKGFIKDAPFVSVMPFFLFSEEPASFPFSFRGRFIENLTVLQDSSRIHFH